MNSKKLRIGYAPYSRDFSAPADRRRFCYYAKTINITYEIADPSKTYDMVIISEGADLSVWCKYNKANTKIIYELIHSYMTIPRWKAKDELRGLAKFATRQNRYLQVDYWKALRLMCGRADAIVCASEEQKCNIKSYNNNIHVISDFQDSEVHTVKSDYSAGQVFNFAWEGFAGNVFTFKVIRDVLNQIAHKHDIAIHLVTDLEYDQYLRTYCRRNTLDAVKKIFRNLSEKVYIYQWNKHMFSNILTACDLAIIPIPLDNHLYAGKPENKLLLFWRMGIPVITSATPAYERAMNESGLQMTCRTNEEWEITLEKYMADESARRNAGQLGKSFVQEHYNDKKLITLWDDLLNSIL